MNINTAYKFVPKEIYNNYIRHTMIYKGSKTDKSYGCVQLIPEEFLYKSFIYKNPESDKNKFKLFEIDLKRSKNVKRGRFNGLYYPITCECLYICINVKSIIDMDYYEFNVDSDK